MDGSVLRVDSLRKALEIEQLLDEHEGPIGAVQLDHDGFLFDLIRTHHDKAEYVLPDRADMTIHTHCLRSFSQRVEKACRDRDIEVTGDLAPTLDTESPAVDEADLLLVPKGRITKRGIREAIRTWMEDGGSAARLAAAQLWQWVHLPTGVLDVGRIVTADLFRELLAAETAAIGGKDTPAQAEKLAKIVLCESFTMPPHEIRQD